MFMGKALPFPKFQFSYLSYERNKKQQIQRVQRQREMWDSGGDERPILKEKGEK